ncbi:Signal transduction histidine kinase [Lachnospiraceae bacterium XBB2008]|nr:Signal transduction histidine kinase [Lachnospiraceae bacterium XBB2008]
MDYSDIIQDRFAEPAAILSYKDGTVSVMEINSRYIPELWMNVSEEDYLGANFQKSYDDENLKLFKNAVEKCIETGEDQTVETWRSLFSDCCGYDKICLLSRLILVEKTGDGAVIYEGIRNISNEKRAQETLTDIEYRYKAASEQINIYNWEYDVATKEMRPCYRCMRDLGLPALVTNYPEPAIDAGIFPPDYADMYRDMMRRIDEGAPELEADIPLTVGRVPFRVKYTTEFNEQGDPVKAFGSATLISETELGHIKLDNQIIGTLAEGYAGIYLADFIKDEVQVIKADDILNIAPGSRCTDLATAIRMILERIDSDEKGLLSDIDHVRVELFRDSDIREFVYKDEGTDRWVRIAAHQMEKGSLGTERMLVTVSVIDDVRAQKMDADRLIAAQKNELEDRQVKLLKAIDEANRANKAKTEFFSNMSHDIRTPMNAITGFSRLAKDEIDDRKHVEDYLDKIVSAGDHLMSLINDILDMSRIESGKMELSPVPVRIKDLIANCADMIRVKMDEKKLDFIVNTSEAGDDIVACDKLRFDQVVLNLLSNAYKFTPEGGKVFLEAALKERKDRFIYEIRVRDTGIGMSAEYKDHIWEAFTRENSTIVNETQGTGLGMLIVRNIVDMMHGNIELITEKGKGSEFIITLPLEPSAETGLAAETDTKATDAMNRKYTGVTVLVVDDTPLNLKLAERILETFDFTVKKAESGVAALDMVKASAPGDIDLILMDVCMPVMDGLETTAKIRELDNAGLARIPIIAMTANAFETDVEAALGAGMNAHIAKPFKKEDLIATISAYLPE